MFGLNIFSRSNPLKLFFNGFKTSRVIHHDPSGKTVKTRFKTILHKEMLKRLREKKMKDRGQIKPKFFHQKPKLERAKKSIKYPRCPRKMLFVRRFHKKHHLDLLKLYTDRSRAHACLLPINEGIYDSTYWREYEATKARFEPIISKFRRDQHDKRRIRGEVIRHMTHYSKRELHKVQKIRKRQISKICFTRISSPSSR